MSLSPMGRDRAQVVPTDCLSCQSAGSVRRGVCDICGARAVDLDVNANLEVAHADAARAGERERLAVPA